MAKTIWDHVAYGFDSGDTLFAIRDSDLNTIYSLTGDNTDGVGFAYVGSETFKGLDWNNATSGVDTLRVRGQLKVHDRGAPGTPDLFAVEVKSEFNATTGVHNCLEVTADWRADGATGGTNRAVVGVSRVRSGQTTSGTANLIGTYGQIANNGTIVGSGLHAALYGLIESGGTWTSVSHLASLWLDNHLAAAPGSGEMSMLYMTNNAAATIGQALYVYAGNKITNLFNINTASTMLSVNDAGGGTLDFSDWRTINIVIEDEAYLLVAAKTIANT